VRYIKRKSAIHRASANSERKWNILRQHYSALGHLVSTVERDDAVIHE
jgi:hypothetical protein